MCFISAWHAFPSTQVGEFNLENLSRERTRLICHRSRQAELGSSLDGKCMSSFNSARQSCFLSAWPAVESATRVGDPPESCRVAKISLTDLHVLRSQCRSLAARPFLPFFLCSFFFIFVKMPPSFLTFPDREQYPGDYLTWDIGKELIFVAFISLAPHRQPITDTGID